jgi:4-hydroxybenzoate polyprenyltransferase
MSQSIVGLRGGFTSTANFLRGTWLASGALGFVALAIHQNYALKNVLLVLGIAVGYAFGFVLNDYFDKEFDKFDEKKKDRNFFVKNSISKRTAVLLISTIIAFLTFVFGWFQLRGLFILSLSLFISWAYSAKPFRFKSRPGFDLVSHSVFIATYPYWITVYLTNNSVKALDYTFMGIAFLLSLTAQIENQIRDFEIDKLTDYNFTQKFGLNTSAYVLKASTLIAFVLMIWGAFTVFPTFMIPYLFILGPWMAHRFIRKNHEPRSLLLMQLTLLGGVLYTMALFITLPFTGYTPPYL